jgi:hypothetical protein
MGLTFELKIMSVRFDKIDYMYKPANHVAMHAYLPKHN